MTAQFQHLFAFKISYNEVENDQEGMITPLYNGNISETFWKTDSDNIKRNYGYQYDALNRLTNSIYQKENVATNSYNEVIGYDKNGNITSMYRTGYQDGSDQSIPFEIDNLIYGYDAKSNQLRSVYDQSAKLDGFRDGNLNGIDYEYDAYGNMNKDRNKKIDLIKYNHLNLPTSITFENGSVITYLYNAVGVKLAKKVTTTSTTESTLIADVDYLTGFQYQKNQLSFFPTAEGYVSVIDGQKFNYVFNYTDHLGNIRVSYGVDPADQQLKILEENHYYPFGLKHSSYNTDQARYKKDIDGISVVLRPTERSEYQYKYQGQERQDEFGLNWDSFKWRNYDYAIGRFMSIDPLAEDYVFNGVYNFSENRVVDGRELEGLEWIKSTSSDGKTIFLNLNVKVINNTGGTLTNDQVNILAAERAAVLSSVYNGLDTKNRKLDICVNFSDDATILWEYNGALDRTGVEAFIGKSDETITATLLSADGITSKIGDTEENRTQVLIAGLFNFDSAGKLNTNSFENKKNREKVSAVGVHEDGHVVGNYHEDDRRNKFFRKLMADVENLMRTDRRGINVLPEQRTQMVDNIRE